ncbi:MAG: hypothetical protein KAS29_16810, partial [Bacteroidales bacterium]|nr:hypothetical protein [Bacteroidales bacterium]
MKIKILTLPALLCLLSFSSAQAQSTNIIPQPQEIIWGEDSFTVNKQIKIGYFDLFVYSEAVLTPDYLLWLRDDVGGLG